MKEKRHKCIACGTVRYEKYMVLMDNVGKKGYWQCGECTETKHRRKTEDIPHPNEIIREVNKKIDMTINQKIEKYLDENFIGSDISEQSSFAEGVDFAIKTVIEMLEEKSYHLGEMGYSKRQDECNDIIKLLKSEA